MSDRIPMTRAGYDKLKAEADQLETVEMPLLTQRVAAARSEGDLSENAEYHGARESQGMLQAKINLLRDKLARALADEIQKQGRSPELLIQVNTGDELQKAGVAPKEADAFIARCRAEFALPIKGLMCIPPEGEEPAMHFALLAKVAARNGLTELSMGMSGDFETAIRFGATMVRVGSALFGARGTL